LLRSNDWPTYNASACLNEVDAALYAAKAAGRNCVRVALPAEVAAAASLAGMPEKVHHTR